MTEQEHDRKIAEWKKGNLSSCELVESLLSHLTRSFRASAINPGMTPQSARRFAALALDQVRRDQDLSDIRHCRQVARLVSAAHRTLIEAHRIAEEKKRRAERHRRFIRRKIPGFQFHSRAEIQRLRQLSAEFAAALESVDNLHIVQPDELLPSLSEETCFAPSLDVGGDIQSSQSAILDLLSATGLTAPDRSALRLLVLRLFGGWSLEQIAYHDGEDMDILNSRWARARELLAMRAADTDDGKTIGRIVTLDVCDQALLRAIRHNPQLLKTVSWRAFEHILAKIIEELGYEIELQRGTKDGGIDFFALKRDATFGSHRYIVQAKRWAGAVGVEPVRQLLFLQQHVHATKACLATTAQFTRGALMLAQEYRWSLELRDFERLKEWLDLVAGPAIKPPVHV